MKEVYAVLRQKELDVSRLQRELEALRVAAPLLLADGEAEDYNQPTLQRAVNETPQPDFSGWKDRGKSHGHRLITCRPSESSYGSTFTFARLQPTVPQAVKPSGGSFVDRVIDSVPCFVVKVESMLFLAMLLDAQHNFLFVVAAHLPITVLRHHI